MMVFFCSSHRWLAMAGVGAAVTAPTTPFERDNSVNLL